MLLVIPLGLLITGCAEPEASSRTQETTALSATATISNLLPVDGCSYPVTIDDVAYAPDETSLTPIRDKVLPGQSITVRVRYDFTGDTGIVECGFGFTQELPQIWFRLESASDPNEPGGNTQPRI